MPSSAGANAGKTAAQILEAASPAERAAVTRAVEQAGGESVRVGSRVVDPDPTGVSPEGAANVVPTPLVIALVLLTVGLAVAGAHTIRSRVHGRRPAAA